MLCPVQGRIGYEDFVIFLLSEVHKSSPIAVAYWFKCLDLDGMSPDDVMMV